MKHTRTQTPKATLILLTLLLTTGISAPVAAEDTCSHDTYTSADTAPTCMDYGYTTHTCVDCGYASKDYTTPWVSHSYTEILAFEDSDHHAHACQWCGTWGTSEACTYTSFSMHNETFRVCLECGNSDAGIYALVDADITAAEGSVTDVDALQIRMMQEPCSYNLYFLEDFAANGHFTVEYGITIRSEEDWAGPVSVTVPMDTSVGHPYALIHMTTSDDPDDEDGIQWESVPMTRGEETTFTAEEDGVYLLIRYNKR